MGDETFETWDELAEAIVMHTSEDPDYIGRQLENATTPIIGYTANTREDERRMRRAARLNLLRIAKEAGLGNEQELVAYRA